MSIWQTQILILGKICYFSHKERDLISSKLLLQLKIKTHPIHNYGELLMCLLHCSQPKFLALLIEGGASVCWLVHIGPASTYHHKSTLKINNNHDIYLYFFFLLSFPITALCHYSMILVIDTDLRIFTFISFWDKEKKK